MASNNLYKKVFTESKTLGTMPITYVELVDTMLAGKLIPGMRYRITDYVTKVRGTLHPTGLDDIAIQSTETPFDIIVTATDVNEISENCGAARNTSDNGYYRNTDIGSWKLKYTVYPTGYTHGCFGPTELEATYIGWDEQEATLDAEYYGIHLVDGVKKVIYKKEGYDTYCYCNNLFPKVGDTLYACERDGEEFLTSEYTTTEYTVSVAPEDDGGKGFIYVLEDENNNVCCYDFKSIQFYDGTTFKFSFIDEGNPTVDATMPESYCEVRDNRITHFDSYYDIPVVKIYCSYSFTENTAKVNYLFAEDSDNTEFVGSCNIEGNCKSCHIRNITIKKLGFYGPTIDSCTIRGSETFSGETILNMSASKGVTFYINTGGTGAVTFDIQEEIPQGTIVTMYKTSYSSLSGQIFGVHPQSGIISKYWDSINNTWVNN